MSLFHDIIVFDAADFDVPFILRIVAFDLLAGGGFLFAHDRLGATQQMPAWMLIFFLASPAAGAAYLTVSEIFPVEIRALAIAVCYAFGTAVGGVGALFLLGSLDRDRVAVERIFWLSSRIWL